MQYTYMFFTCRHTSHGAVDVAIMDVETEMSIFGMRTLLPFFSDDSTEYAAMVIRCTAFGCSNKQQKEPNLQF